MIHLPCCLSTWMTNKKNGNKQQGGSPNSELDGTVGAYTYHCPNSHVNGYKSLSQKVHQRYAIEVPPDQISINRRAIADCTLCSPILQ